MADMRDLLLRYGSAEFRLWSGNAKAEFLSAAPPVVFLAGPSGTGKTLAAEWLASRTGLPLFRVEIRDVVGQYIGETEKNLARVFQQAAASHALLFFDEADALFGKRSSVTDSHDRYANQEISYLLQQLERYTGAALVSTKSPPMHGVSRRKRVVITVP